MGIEEFEEIAQEEFDALPARFREAVENVRIVVAAHDTPGDRRRAGARGSAPLLGLYEGIPVPKRGIDYGVYPALPDTITLFQGSIEAVSRTPGEIRRTIRETLIHEIAHHFGFSEDEIREAGYG
jgi:predicted Zn-dependent protease with MMP-like domain